jgi:hypothetical protein
VEGQAQASRVPLSQAPLVKDQVVLPHQRERVIERPHGGGREYDVIERAPGLDSFDELAPG